MTITSPLEYCLFVSYQWQFNVSRVSGRSALLCSTVKRFLKRFFFKFPAFVRFMTSPINRFLMRTNVCLMWCCGRQIHVPTYSAPTVSAVTSMTSENRCVGAVMTSQRPVMTSPGARTFRTRRSAPATGLPTLTTVWYRDVIDNNVFAAGHSGTWQT